MKAIVLMVLAIGLSNLTSASEKMADPVGTWKCEYGGDGRTCTLTIKKSEGKFTGSMSWPDQKETSVKDLKVKGGSLKFSVSRKLADGEDEAIFEFALTIDRDKIQGKGETFIMGTKQEFDIGGKRKK